ncbi:head GIN domain-containing protein [Candidatus Ulvibacter alkanivorans]|uniref:head GIN domain-containing protein n=1 Tax=Candidatus Ulvibacter alkanivorans TaxID=2267620 RepID=UPI000DF1FA19|nr:head GIN domain-containing protein [Candidatus Ulvibacter alkanivorans]
MKYKIVVALVVLFSSCNSEDAWDCLQTTGPVVSQEFELANFDKVSIENDITLIVKQGPQQLRIETGENLLPDISVSLDGETLRIKNNNKCEFVREYETTTVYLTAPNLTEIRNSSYRNVRSDGVLQYPVLSLVSNTTAGPEDVAKGGDFILEVECEQFFVAANGQSLFVISGFSEKATIGFEDEIPRFDGADFIVNDLNVFQRSANTMTVNPQERIRGKIYGTGDVISLNRPPIVDVEEFFTGRLIFQD